MTNVASAQSAASVGRRLVIELDEFIGTDGKLNAYYVIESPKRKGSGVLFERYHVSGEVTYLAARYRVKRKSQREWGVSWLGKNKRATPMHGGVTHDELVSIAAMIDRIGKW